MKKNLLVLVLVIFSSLSIGNFVDTVQATVKSDRSALRSRIKKARCRIEVLKTTTAQKQCVKNRMKRLDVDKDGIPKRKDNCPTTSNNDQVDQDSDGLGDACDNCPTVFNPEQKDTNQDGVGSACSVEGNISL